MARKVTADEMQNMTCCDNGDTQFGTYGFVCVWENLKIK